MKIRDLVETARFPEDGAFHLHRWRHRTMKRLLTFFTLSLLLVACETQPVGVGTPDAQFAKGGKPDKPEKPTSCELIAFTGDLMGSQEVEGCCPNAGPFPEFTMALRSPPFAADISEPHDGNIFMSSWGRKGEGDYMVQFWWGAEPDVYFMEIRGGVKVEDKRSKKTTVTFDNEIMTISHTGDDPLGVPVSFTLTREPAG